MALRAACSGIEIQDYTHTAARPLPDRRPFTLPRQGQKSDPGPQPTSNGGGGYNKARETGLDFATQLERYARTNLTYLTGFLTCADAYTDCSDWGSWKLGDGS